MILGLGSDIVDIRRVELVLQRFGERFTHRVFTEVERRRSDGRADRAASYARRFTAKEAFSKALGTGIRRGVYFRDIGVGNLASGKPTVELTGGAASRLAELMPPGMRARIDLSLADDHPTAQAIVLISAVPAKER